MYASVYPLRKALATNSTATEFTAQTPTATEPSGDGVFKLTDSKYGVGVNGKVPDRLFLQPYGGNASNDIFNMRLWGYSKTHLPDFSDAYVYVPILLGEWACTLGNISSTALGTNMLLVDTLVLTYGDANERTLGNTVASPANDVAGARAIVFTQGVEYIKFDFDMDTGGDAANCLWRALHHH